MTSPTNELLAFLLACQKVGEMSERSALMTETLYERVLAKFPDWREIPVGELIDVYEEVSQQILGGNR